MKTIQATPLYLPFLLVLSLFLSACGGGSSSNDETSPPEMELSTKNISVNILKVDGSAFTQNVEMSFSGAAVTDTSGNAITSATFPAVKNIQAKIDPDTTVDLKLLAKSANFVDSGVTLQLSPEVTDYTATIYLVSNTTGSSRAGIYTKVDTINAVTNAVAQSEITLALEESASTPNLTVTIPEGTQFSDANGNPISPNSSTLVRYDPLESGVLDAYPGGLNVQADVNGVMEQVNFKSAGFASIVLKDSAGTKVKNFDRDITIAMQFTIGITDNNGQVAKVGDIVPVWSYDEDEGTWRYERDGTIADLDTTDGLYDVTYNTNHLTFYNLDWDIANVCLANIKVEDANGSVQTNAYEVQFLMPAFNIDRTISYLGDGNIVLNGAPAIPTPWELIFKDTNSDAEIGRYSSSESICDEHIAIVDVDSADTIDTYQVNAVSSITAPECPTATGFITVTNDTDVRGNVEGFPIEGTRDANNGQVTFGLVGNTILTIATFDGSINNNQANGTWAQSDGSCSGTWTGTLTSSTSQ